MSLDCSDEERGRGIQEANGVGSSGRGFAGGGSQEYGVAP